jgi:TPR repeat protein
MRPAALQPFEPDESYTIAFNFAKLRKAIRHAAKRGDVVAQSTLGTHYLCGYGVTQNLVVALKWLKKAANQGECNAQFFLGEMYRDGEGVQPDDEEAAKWFRLAAAQGDVQAQQELAILCSPNDSLKRLDLTVTSSDPRHRRASRPYRKTE